MKKYLFTLIILLSLNPIEAKEVMCVVTEAFDINNFTFIWIISFIVSFIIGFIIFMPKVFGNIWSKGMNLECNDNEKNKGILTSMIIAIISDLMLSFLVTFIVQSYGAPLAMFLAGVLTINLISLGLWKKHKKGTFLIDGFSKYIIILAIVIVNILMK